MAFSDELQKISWEATAEQIEQTTETDARRALAKKRLDVCDFMSLISPAAIPFLEEMARKSQALTRSRFGKTMHLFIPLYLSNACANSCVYCGFHVSNKMPRIVLSETEIVAEYEAIRRLAPFDSILLLTGEHPARAGVGYIARALELAKPYFSDRQVEVMPLSTAEYRQLVASGLNGVVCFQETYHRENYNTFHPHGKKADFEWRVNGFDRMGQAGVHKISLGTLVGLDTDWRTDVTMMAYHLRYLQKRYWRTRYGFNFPRMRPSENDGFQPNTVMSDRELAQLTFAARLFDPDVDISYSTRESAPFRDAMATLGVTLMSAGSRTEPGGYATYPQALEQFSVSDDRTPKRVCEALVTQGLEPVWKDWSTVFTP